jgi:excisionase family DNA binding protein
MSKKLSQPSATVFISVPEAVKVTGYSRNHIYNLITQNKVRFQEEGHKVLVSLEDVKKRSETNKNRIKKLRNRKNKSVRKVVSNVSALETIKTTSNNSVEGTAFILAVILGIVVGYLIATSLK